LPGGVGSYQGLPTSQDSYNPSGNESLEGRPVEGEGEEEEASGEVELEV